VLERLSYSPSIQEILWNFSRFKDEKRRLTLRENPHFYAELPTSPEAYGDSFKINPTEKFRHTDTSKFYVLTNKPELVYIMADKVLKSFGNFWFPKDAIIFKGLVVLFCLFSVPEALPGQTSVGGLWEGALSRHLSPETPVGSVLGDSWCPPFQEILGIIVDCSRLLNRSLHGWAGHV
jgi:hypothetical protein